MGAALVVLLAGGPGLVDGGDACVDGDVVDDFVGVVGLVDDFVEVVGLVDDDVADGEGEADADVDEGGFVVVAGGADVLGVEGARSNTSIQ